MVFVPDCQEEMMCMLEKAIGIAVRAHTGQVRRGGMPYILHPIRVMLRQADHVAMIVGVLHDVIEDTDVTLSELEQDGFPEKVIHALCLLTHEDDVPYDAYIAAIASNPVARSVKLADLQDNMDLLELPVVTDNDLIRTAKYHRAWKTLCESG